MTKKYAKNKESNPLLRNFRKAGFEYSSIAFQSLCFSCFPIPLIPRFSVCVSKKGARATQNTVNIIAKVSRAKAVIYARPGLTTCKTSHELQERKWVKKSESARREQLSWGEREKGLAPLAFRLCSHRGATYRRREERTKTNAHADGRTFPSSEQYRVVMAQEKAQAGRCVCLTFLLLPFLFPLDSGKKETKMCER